MVNDYFSLYLGLNVSIDFHVFRLKVWFQHKVNNNTTNKKINKKRPLEGIRNDAKTNNECMGKSFQDR